MYLVTVIIVCIIVCTFPCRTSKWMHSWWCSLGWWHKSVSWHSRSLFLWTLGHCVWQILVLGFYRRKSCLQTTGFLQPRLVAHVQCMYAVNDIVDYYRGHFSSLCIFWPRKWTSVYDKRTLQWKWDTSCELLPQYTTFSILLTLLWCWSGVPRWVVF